MTETTLPAGFTLTQTALRTYLACPYRFRLRYVEGVPWPTLPQDPSIEAAMERGRRFHELARQHFLGIEVSEQVEVADPELVSWWEALQAHPPDLVAYPQRYPEAGLSIPLSPYRLGARYDLLALSKDAALIVDWKTGRSLPPGDALIDDIQSRIYLYVLAEGGGAYHPAGRAFLPASLTLLYWHPQGPQQVALAYSATRRDEDGLFLRALVEQVTATPVEALGRTEDEEACGRCAYAPLCGRAGGGGWSGESPEEPTVDIEGGLGRTALTWP